MKDTLITAKRKKIELITFIICFIIANIGNIWAIIDYKASFDELYKSLGYVMIATIVIYCIWTFLRLIFYGIISLFAKK
ncbi:MAG: hypothetical protein Q4F97_07510 [Bacteroidales bacterium]|nr:hypothetical protein [Bacteroidales bacterium]